MSEYELFNEKTAEFLGSYLSDKMLEKGDVVTSEGEDYIISYLLIPSDRKLRVAVWPAKIYLPVDIGDLRLLRWIQQNLIGAKIRLTNNKGSVEGEVISYWPGKRIAPPDILISHDRPEIFIAEEFPDRLEFLNLGSDNPTIIDLLDYTMIEILGKQV